MTLRELIARQAPIGPARVIRLGRQLASALGAIHARGIIHRDLKPRNVMVTDPPEEKVKLIDFGLAKVELDNVAPVEQGDDPLKRSLSAAGVVFGTVGYMAPETALGMRAVTAKSDLYSLGVLLYEMLAKEHPFKAVDPKKLFAMHRSVKPPSIRESNPKTQVPAALEALVMQLLEKEPGARPASAEEVVKKLDEISATITGRATLVSMPSVPPPRRSYAPHIAFGVVAVGATAVALYFVNEASKPQAAPSASASAPPPPVESASAAPSASPLASALIGAKSNEDARLVTRLRGELADGIEKKNLSEAAATLKAIADVAPLALRDPTLRASAAKLANLAGEKAGPDSDKVFYALASSFGTDGLDLLYELRSSAVQGTAQRAAALIETNSSKVSTELRVTLDLEHAACRLKPLLFERAGKEGDQRTLTLLDGLRTPNCDMSTSPCCFQKDTNLERAVDALHTKLGVPQK